MSRAMLFTWAVVIAILFSLSWAVDHYRLNAIQYKEQRNKAASERDEAKAAISDMQTRQRDVAALGAKYTQELADARHTIDELQRDVVAGTKRLRVNNTCQPVSEAPGTASVDDATSPGLTDAAQRDYFRLRERIEISSKMIAGLQEYIRQQCLE